MKLLVLSFYSAYDARSMVRPLPFAAALRGACLVAVTLPPVFDARACLCGDADGKNKRCGVVDATQKSWSTRGCGCGVRAGDAAPLALSCSMAASKSSTDS